MRTTVFISALLLCTLAVSAQEKKVSENKQATVRIKKVENINGVEKITDTTYTVDDASSIPVGDDVNVEIINVEDGKGNGKMEKVFIVNDGKVITNDNGVTTEVKVINNGEGMDEEVKKALKEAGVDPENCKGTKKMVVVTEDIEPGNEGKKETKTTKIVMIKMNITDASPEDMKRLNTQLGKSDNKLQMDEMKMFPNPHDGKFKLNFNLKDKGDAKVSIFNIEGKEVYSEKLPNFTGEYNKNIDISSNKKGVYFVKIEQGTHSQVKKVVLE